ncbi:uncharacterized protein VTP21DRAFT_5312 [Calcarisporiella thermophila]|uniref:uncharacterized protein n=1 Tax=Calcarisporiella thermophila TaxID=911321 RepID=UPI0037420210
MDTPPSITDSFMFPAYAYDQLVWSLFLRRRNLTTTLSLALASVSTLGVILTILPYLGVTDACQFINPLTMLSVYGADLFCGLVLLVKATAIHARRSRLVLAGGIVCELTMLAAICSMIFTQTAHVSPYGSCYPVFRIGSFPLLFRLISAIIKFGYLSLCFIIPLRGYLKAYSNQVLMRVYRDGLFFFIAISITEIIVNSLIIIKIDLPIISVLAIGTPCLSANLVRLQLSIKEHKTRYPSRPSAFENSINRA